MESKPASTSGKKPARAQARTLHVGPEHNASLLASLEYHLPPETETQRAYRLKLAEYEGLSRRVAEVRREQREPSPELVKAESRAYAEARAAAAERERSSQLDEFDLLIRQGVAISPWLDPRRAVEVIVYSDILSACIYAMAKNVGGHGYDLVPVLSPDAVKKLSPVELQAMEDEKGRIEAFFDYCHPELPFVEIRRRTTADRESLAYAAWEVLRPIGGGPPVGLNPMPAWTIMFGPLSDYVDAPMPRRQADGSWTTETVPYRFRNVLQFVNGRMVWFKQMGDPRVVDRRTGRAAQNDAEAKQIVDAGFTAREVLLFVHYGVSCGTTPYGIPRWVGAVYAAIGRRQAAEVNLSYFANKAVPPLAVLVSGGQLTRESGKAIEDHFRALKGKNNFHDILILEALPMDAGDGLTDAKGRSNVRVQITPLAEAMNKDALFSQYSKDCIDDIQLCFGLPPVLIGRCHSEDTEYLTEDGWLRFMDVPEGAKVASFNTTTGMIEMQAPTARHSYEWNGPLLHLKNRGIDALVTPNHRFWTRPTVPTGRRERNWEFIEASDLAAFSSKGNGGCLELPVNGQWEGAAPPPTFTIPAARPEYKRKHGAVSKNQKRDAARAARLAVRFAEKVVPIKPFLRFLGYFVAEGSTCAGNRGVVSLSQNAGPVADDMIATMRAMGFPPGVFTGKSRPNELNISVCHAGLWVWLRENCGVNSKEKRLPRWVLGLDQDSLRTVLDAMVDGDGSIPKGGSPGAFTYVTTSPVLNDQLHEVCVRLGIALVSRRFQSSNVKWAEKFQSNSHRDHRHLIHARQINEVQYRGVVSCFTVPNGTLVTRRNGRVLISGNSTDYNRATASTAVEVADRLVLQPEREFEDHIINRRILSELGARYWKFKTRAPAIVDEESAASLLTLGAENGAIFPEEIRAIIARLLGHPLPPIGQPWANRPVAINTAMAANGDFTKGDIAPPAAPGMPPGAPKPAAPVTSITATKPARGAEDDDEPGQPDDADDAEGAAASSAGAGPEGQRPAVAAPQRTPIGGTPALMPDSPPQQRVFRVAVPADYLAMISVGDDGQPRIPDDLRRVLRREYRRECGRIAREEARKAKKKLDAAAETPPSAAP